VSLDCTPVETVRWFVLIIVGECCCIRRYVSLDSLCDTVAMCYAGHTSVTTRLTSPSRPLLDALVTVSVTGAPLLSGDMQCQLNPMVIKVHGAVNMPDTPVSYDELQDR
jgi:hypothetical protein